MTIRQGYFPAVRRSEGRRHVRGAGRRRASTPRSTSCGSNSPEISRIRGLRTLIALTCAACHVRASSFSAASAVTGLRRPCDWLTVNSLPNSPLEADPDNEPTADSAERRNLADALAHERNVLRTMIDLIPAFIYAKDAQSRFTACNKLVANRMGVDARRAHRQDRLRFLPARDGGEILRRRAGADQVRQAAARPRGNRLRQDCAA